MINNVLIEKGPYVYFGIWIWKIIMENKKNEWLLDFQFKIQKWLHHLVLLAA